MLTCVGLKGLMHVGCRLCGSGLVGLSWSNIGLGLSDPFQEQVRCMLSINLSKTYVNVTYFYPIQPFCNTHLLPLLTILWIFTLFLLQCRLKHTVLHTHHVLDPGGIDPSLKSSQTGNYRSYVYYESKLQAHESFVRINIGAHFEKDLNYSN